MQSDEEQIRNLVSTWMAATKAGDVDKVLSLIADDAVFLVAGQPPMLRSDFAALAVAQAGENAPQFDGSSEIQEIKVLGDWAFMWASLTVVATQSNGERIVRAGHTLTLLKKKNGRWLLARDANMLAPVPQAGC
jgi:uncharacterized protein (TIGR02246 family)